MAIEYSAGEAWVVADGEGEIGVAVDGERADDDLESHPPVSPRSRAPARTSPTG